MRAHHRMTMMAAVILGAPAAACFWFSPVRAQLPVPALTTSAGPAPTAREWNVRHSPVVDVVRKVKAAVVNIHSERTVRASTEELFSLTPSQSRVNGMGTGIVIDARGWIVTNQHVVDDVSSLRVRLADGTNLSASVVARDPESDLALIKVNPTRDLQVMPLGTTRDLQVGETVVAIGNAYGYDHTVTVGVVSAIGRDVTLNRDVRYRSLIQTDASINPGNSGGPLINLNGELIGVNVAIRAGAQGIGFAIPVDNMIKSASAMLVQVRSRGEVAPVGLLVHDEVNGGVSTRRVLVDQVSRGAAEKAGLRQGDELLRMGDLPVANSLDVQRGLLDCSIGQRVAVIVRRAGGEQKLQMALESAPRAHGQTDSETAASQQTAALTAGADNSTTQIWRSLGVRFQNVANLAEIIREHPQLHGGLYVSEIRPESPASRAGLRVGDVLVGMHQWEMLTVENVSFVLNHPDRRTFSPIRFFILRGGQVHRGYLQPGE